MANVPGHITDQDYRDLPLDWLRSELAAWQRAHSALALAESYELVSGNSSRRLKRTDLPLVRDTMRALHAEIRRQEGVAAGTSITRTTRADFSGFLG